jgi:hypothetical protein
MPRVHDQVLGYLYVGDLIVGEAVSGLERHCGIAASMHCRMTAFLSEADETCAT